MFWRLQILYIYIIKLITWSIYIYNACYMYLCVVDTWQIYIYIYMYKQNILYIHVKYTVCVISIFVKYMLCINVIYIYIYVYVIYIYMCVCVRACVKYIYIYMYVIYIYIYVLNICYMECTHIYLYITCYIYIYHHIPNQQDPCFFVRFACKHRAYLLCWSKTLGFHLKPGVSSKTGSDQLETLPRLPIFPPH